MVLNPRRYQARHGHGRVPVVPQRPRTPTLPGDDLTADVTMTGTLDAVTTGFHPETAPNQSSPADASVPAARPSRLRTPRPAADLTTAPQPARKRKVGPRRISVTSQSAIPTSSPRMSDDAAPRTSTGSPSSFSAEDRSAARSSFIMFLGTLTSRILGMVKSPFLMGAVVALNTPVASSWDIANKLPNLLYMVIAGGLVNAVLVPAIVRASKDSKDQGAKFINKLLTLTTVVLGAITVLLMLLAPLIVKLYASTMSNDWFSLTVLFAYWSMPQVFFYGLYTVFGQILNARENFGPYTWAPVLNNIVAIAGLIIILAIWGPESVANPSAAPEWHGVRAAALAGFSTMGVAAQALILLVPMRRLGIRFQPDFQWRGSGLGRAGKASMWVLATMLVGMIPTMVQTNVTAGATERAHDMGIAVADVANNFAYTTAYAIYSLPTSLITVSITTAMFTRLAKAAAVADRPKLVSDTSKTLRSVSTLNFLAAAGIIALAVPVSRVIMPFVSPAETRSLAGVLVAMTIGLGGVGIVTVLNKVYYALEDTRGAFLIGLPWQVMGILGFALCGFLPPDKVVIGVGLVMSVSNILAAIVMYVVLSKRLGGLDVRRVLTTHAKLLLSAGMSLIAGIGWVTYLGRDHMSESFAFSLVSVVFIGVIMIAVYLICLTLLRMPEADQLMAPLKSVLRKLRMRT